VSRPILKSSPLALAQEAKSIFEAADMQGRALTADERVYVEQLLERAEERGHAEQRLKATGLFGNGGPMLPAGGFEFGHPQTIGEAFTSSEQYKAFFGPGGARPERWSMPPIEVPYTGVKGTLLEGSGSPGSGTGGGLVPTPMVVPGVVQTLFFPLNAEQLFDSGITDSNTVRYIVEGTATSGAGGVAEGGTKPESTLGLSTKDEPVRKVATFLPVSDELLEDAAGIQNFLNSRLGFFVAYEVERELWRGTSGGNEVQGLLTSRGVPVYTGGTADNKAVQIFKALNSMRGSQFIEPDWIAMHPTDYQIIRLLTDTAGQFFGGGPFLGPYGNATDITSGNSVTQGMTDTLWGKPLYVSAGIGGAGTAIIGTKANARVWNRGGLRVEASNSHASFFQTDLVALRAERRLALAVYRAGGYVECRLAVGPGG
jgi:HK97 family phage major capsid protein